MGILRHRHRWWHILGGVLLLVCSSFAQTELPSVPEYKLKAGFIYNFAKLTEWPTNAFSSSNAPIRIAIVGADTLATYLEEATKDRTVNGRGFLILRVKPSPQVTNSHVLFIDASASDDVDQLPVVLRKLPILTIGESQRFTEYGGIIRLIKDEGVMRFEVKRSAAERAGLRLSSRLLALARKPVERRRP